MVLAVFLLQPGHAQQLLKISLLCQGFGTPASGFPDPLLSYGLRLGSEWRYAGRGLVSLGQDVNLTMYVHKEMQTSLMLTTSPVVRLQLQNGLLAYFSLGGGKAFNIMSQRGYTDNGDGTFEPVKHAFYAPWLATGSLGVGYDLSAVSPVRLALFVETQTTAELVKNQYTPVFPHHLFHLGTRIPLAGK